MIPITKILILTGRGADKLFFDTDLPPSFYPYQQPPSLTMEVAADLGERYASNNFPGVPVTVQRIGTKPTTTPV